MLKVINTSSDQVVAQRIVEDFRQAGYQAESGAPARGDVLILILSPAALADQTLQAALIGALDLSLHIIPVMTQPVKLPKLIDHLDVVNFSDGYDFAVLRQQVEIAQSSNAPSPVRVLTPSVKRSNRSAGIVLAVAALVMFAVGLYAVGVLHIQAPLDEFNTEYTMDAMTRDVMIAPELQAYAQFLPESSEEAANYLPTLRAVPTLYRPFVAMTATAVADRAEGN